MRGELEKKLTHEDEQFTRRAQSGAGTGSKRQRAARFRETMGRPMTSDPRLVYSRLLEERRADIASRERRHRTLGYGRLAAVTAAAAVVWLALTGQLSIVWITVPIAVFAVLVVIHDHLLRVSERRRRAQRFFERALARLDGKWAGTGDPGDRYLDPAHPYARDLDLFGPASLFELLSTARTHIGADTDRKSTRLNSSHANISY